MNTEKEKQKLRRYLDDTYLMTDTQELYTDLSDTTKNKDVLEELAAEVWEESSNHVSQSEHHQKESYREAQQLIHRIENKRHFRMRKLFRYSVGIAASLLLVFSSISLYKHYEAKDAILSQVETTFGERKNIVLSDGSQIVLNSCSRLEYPNKFSADHRTVKLEGEAYFQITHKEDQPFLVKTGNFDVKVLGTEFNVKSYEGDDVVSVEVNSGKVQVSLPEAVLRLKQKERISVNTTSGEFNKKNGNDKVALWRKGSFSFNSTPIRDVARELERSYHCEIEFQEGQEFDNLITGEHDHQNLESILESLQYVCGINYKKEGKKIILYK